MSENTISKICGVVFLILYLSTAGAQVSLTPYTEDVSVTGLNSELFEDPTRQLNFEEVRHRKFTKPGTGDLKNVNPGSAYWIRFNVFNRSGDEVKWVLETLTPNLQSLEVWVQDAEGRIRTHSAGLSKNFFKEYSHKNYVFDLPSGAEHYEVYARFYSPNISGLEFKIRTQQYFTWYALQEYYFLGIYYGVLLIIFIYNFFLFVTNREKVYLFYSLYLTGCLFLSLSEDGLGVELLWREYSSVNLYFYYYLAPSYFLITFLLYARSFLNLKKTFPLADKTIIAVSVLMLGVMFVQSFTREIFQLADFYIIPFVLIYGASLYVYFKGYKAARFFILAYTIIFFSMIVLQLRLHRIIGADILTVYVFNFGILFETVILSFALGDRLRIIRKGKEEADKNLVSQLQENSFLQKRLLEELKEKNELTEKVNKELEQKVQERTCSLQQKTDELVQANEKLDLYSRKLTEMNVKLDLDNWQLKNEVKEERKARIVQEELTYDEFMKVFPDTNACLRYLEDLKWGEKYQCMKCGNEKFSSRLFSRKCTRCNYIESPTSNTLFHGVKIPLNKTFYMVYASCLKGKKPTIEETGDLLGIGKNTCWSFRKKIRERQASRKKRLQGKEAESWEALILD